MDQLESKPLGSLKDYINISEEDKNTYNYIYKIANDKNVVILSFIAPYIAKRISPIQTIGPSIGLYEEFGIENAISKIIKETQKKIKKLYLLLNTPGGSARSSYKIAYIIRKYFEDITVFIPHIAASGGTLIAMVGNKIVMGDMSQLTPIDAQVLYQGRYVSANLLWWIINEFDKNFGNKLPEEIPYHWRMMAQKLDPLIWQEWDSNIFEIHTYANEILTMTGYKEKERSQIIRELLFTRYSHGFVINKERANKIGFNIDNSNEMLEIFELMRGWFSNYINTKDTSHSIRYFYPTPKP